jgi:hypothetical protein
MANFEHRPSLIVIARIRIGMTRGEVVRPWALPMMSA